MLGGKPLKITNSLSRVVRLLLSISDGVSVLYYAYAGLWMQSKPESNSRRAVIVLATHARGSHQANNCITVGTR